MRGFHHITVNIIKEFEVAVVKNSVHHLKEMKPLIAIYGLVASVLLNDAHCSSQPQLQTSLSVFTMSISSQCLNARKCR